ncbi:MAG: lipoyl(octanoyl) transferase LipB [Rhodospirillaceae bacterium]
MDQALTSAPQETRTAGGPVEFRTSEGLVPYPEAVAFMEERVKAIRAGTAPECVWFLEHPPLYTAGTSSKPADLLAPNRFPVFPTGRGGEYTYHGPGQRVAYVMLDLNRAGWSGGGPDVRRFVFNLEAWLIKALDRLGVTGERRAGRIGIWVDRGGGREDKIAALGIRVRHWITFHGIALNVAPELEHFSGIVPCGISGHGVTSLRELGLPTTMGEADDALRASFRDVFNVSI